MDPLADDYSYKSTYDYAENGPINAIDLDGLEKLVTIGVGGKPIFNSGLDRGRSNFKVFNGSSLTLIPKRITEDSQWYKDLKAFFSGNMGIDIRGKNDNKFGAKMSIGRDRTKNMKVVIMNLAEDNNIALLLDLHSSISATPNKYKSGWGESFKTASDFLDKKIDELISKHPIHTDDNYYETSIKGVYYKKSEPYSSSGYDENGQPQAWERPVYSPDYTKSNDGMESTPIIKIVGTQPYGGKIELQDKKK